MADSLGIVARLELRAQEFSSETGRAFAEMRERAATAASSVRTEFLSSFSDVQRIAKQSLALPRTTGGGLDLSAEIGQLRASADAQDLRTAAFQAYVLAAERAAGGGAQLSEAALREADAARVSAQASQQDSAALRERIALLQTIHTELQQTAVAESAEAEAAALATRAAEQAAQARRDAAFAYDQFERIAREKMTAYREQLALTTAAEREAAALSEQVAAAHAEVQGRRFADAFTPTGSGKSARESAAVFEEMARAEREAEQGAAALEARVLTLRNAIDPAGAAQRRYNAEIANARELVQQGAISLDEYIAKLRLEDQALVAVSTGHRGFVASAGQQRQSMIQLGQQVQDFTVQVSSGANVTTAFSQQIGQAAFALQGMGGKMEGVAAFLTSGWGIAAVIGVTALAPLVAKLLEGNDALTKAVDKLKQHAQQSAIDAEANRQWEHSLDGQIEKQRRLNDELDREIKTRRRINQEKVSDSRETVAGLSGRMRDQSAAFIAAGRERDLVAGMGGDAGRIAREGAQRKLDEAKAALDLTTQQLIDAQRTERSAQIAIMQDRVDARHDPRAAAQQAYDDGIDRLNERFARGVIDAAGYDRAFDKLKTTLDAATAAAHASNAEFGRSITSAQARSIAERAGMRVNSDDRTYGQQAQLYNAWVAAGKPSSNPVARPGTSAHERGDALDIQKTAGLTVAQIKAAFAAEGVRLTKIISEQGHWHVEWARGREEADAFNRAAEQARQEATQVKSLISDANRMAREMSSNWHPGHVDLGAPLAPNGLRQDSLVDGIEPFKVPHIELQAKDDLKDQIDYATNYWRDQHADNLRYLSGLYGDLFNGQTDNIVENLRRTGADAIGRYLAEQTQHLFDRIHLPKGLTDLLKGSAAEGAGFGGIGGSVFSAITGGKNNTVASQIGGVVGDVAGKALGKLAAKEIGGALGKTLGGAAGPIGAVVGGILGDALGGLFKKAQNSGAGISTAGGAFGAGTAIGTSSALSGQASSLAGSVSSGLQRIADALGASITGSTDVRIGTSNGNIHINTHGGQIGQKGSGDTNFGSDQEGAVRAAIADALTDGVLSGISDAAQRILKSGQDIDRALSKALSIESIPKDLKAMLDPVGAALDALNTKWKATVAALNEGGASAEQYADAEKLYNLQLDQVKASTASASQGLKDFLLTLKIGSNSPLSLRDQEATAKAALQPYLDTIGAGGAVDQSKYQAAAQSFLDIERQLYGSTQVFFDQFDAIQAATNRAIDAIDNAVPVSTPVADPFVKATAENTATGNELLSQVSDQLATATALLQGILGNTGAGSAGFIGGGRNFALAA